MASLFAPRNVILAAVAVYALAIGAAALERRAAGVDADALVAAAIGVSGAPGGEADDACAAAGIKAIAEDLEF